MQSLSLLNIYTNIIGKYYALDFWKNPWKMNKFCTEKNNCKTKKNYFRLISYSKTISEEWDHIFFLIPTHFILIHINFHQSWFLKELSKSWNSRRGEKRKKVQQRKIELGKAPYILRKRFNVFQLEVIYLFYASVFR